MRESLAFMYLSLGGRIGRQDFWLYFLLPAAVYGLLRFVPGFASSALELAMLIVIAWPAIAVQVKRWHDLDFTGWCILVNAVPVAGWLISLLVGGFLPGTRGENQYGEDPLGEPAARAPARPVARPKSVAPPQGRTRSKSTVT